ncbi:hypothetical protein PoB_002014700, partial [Plakobranchus ocellatus]
MCLAFFLVKIPTGKLRSSGMLPWPYVCPGENPKALWIKCHPHKFKDSAGLGGVVNQRGIMAYAMWILPVFQLALWLGFCSAADFTKSECFDTKEPNQQGSITISCPEDHVISVDGAVFGSNKWGACIITEDDCTEQTKIFAVCDGLVNCTRNFKTFTRTCGYSTMLVLGYSCIK